MCIWLANTHTYGIGLANAHVVLKLKIVVWKVTLVRGLRQTLMPLCPGGNHKGIPTQEDNGQEGYSGVQISRILCTYGNNNMLSYSGVQISRDICAYGNMIKGHICGAYHAAPSPPLFRGVNILIFSLMGIWKVELWP